MRNLNFKQGDFATSFRQTHAPTTHITCGVIVRERPIMCFDFFGIFVAGRGHNIDN